MCQVAAHPDTEHMKQNLKTLAALIEPTPELVYVPTIYRGKKGNRDPNHGKGRDQANKYLKHAKKFINENTGEYCKTIMEFVVETEEGTT